MSFDLDPRVMADLIRSAALVGIAGFVAWGMARCRWFGDDMDAGR